MKKFVFMLMASAMLALTGCNVGVHSVTSGSADECAVCFVSTDSYDISVDIDGTVYELKTVKQKSYKAHRDIKARANEQIIITPGRHKVKVMRDGKEVYSKEIFVSATETKVIEI